METEPTEPGSVKQDREENAVIFPANIPEELSEKVRRFNGYVRGCFSNGKPYEQVRYLRRKFSKARGLSWDHIDRVSRVWMKWTSEYKFSRHRFGRSTCIVVTPRARPLIVSTAEARRRLAGAIRNHIAKSGRCHVDRRFLEGFHERHGLPPEQILAAWRSLYFVEGCVCRWKQKDKQGRGRNLYVQAIPHAAWASSVRQAGGRAKNLKTAGPAVLAAGWISPRQNTPGISPPTGGYDRKTGASPDRLPNRSSGASPHPGELGEGIGPAAPAEHMPGGDAKHRAARPGAGEHGPEPNRYETPGFSRWKSAREPLHVCNRFVRGEALRRKAAWISFTILLQMHQARPRVKFGEPHALNFCDRALRLGYRDSEICAAYQVGLDEAQASAEKDLQMADRRDPWEAAANARTGAVGLREPSQVIARAWIRLASDRRTPEERWREFFAANPRGVTSPASARLETSQVPPGIPTRKTRSGSTVAKWAPRTIADLPPEIGIAEKLARQAAKLPDTAPAVLKLQRKDHATFEMHLAARGLTLQDLMKMPRAEQQKFVREAQAAQRERSEKE